MKKKKPKYLWIILYIFIGALIVSCGQNEETDTSRATDTPKIKMTKPVIQATDTLTSTKTHQQRPSETVVKIAPGTTPTLRVQPEMIGVSISLSKEALANAENIPSDNISVKEEIFFLGGFSFGASLECIITSDLSIPLIGYQYDGLDEIIHVCLVGFPKEDPLEIDLYTPDGDFVTSQILQNWDHDFPYYYYIDTLFIREDGGLPMLFDHPGSDPNNDDSQVLKNESLFLLDFWQPVGLPQGDWQIIVKSGNLSTTGVIPVMHEDQSISVLPGLLINPFEFNACSQFEVGDLIYIAGYGFSPHTEIPLGFYYDTEERVPGGDHNNLGQKIYGTKVNTSEEGDFIFAYRIRPEDPGKRIRIEALNVPDPSIFPYGPCFEIINVYFPTQTANIKKQSDPDFCPGVLPARLEVGDIASVSLVPPDPNIVREKAGKQEKRLGLIQPGERIEILKGPKCVDGWIWWKVRSLNTGLVGWTAQGDHKDYWIIPEG